jgi:hypothetical protein
MQLLHTRRQHIVRHVVQQMQHNSSRHDTRMQRTLNSPMLEFKHSVHHVAHASEDHQVGCCCCETLLSNHSPWRTTRPTRRWWYWWYTRQCRWYWTTVSWPPLVCLIPSHSLAEVTQCQHQMTTSRSSLISAHVNHQRDQRATPDPRDSQEIQVISRRDWWCMGVNGMS